MKIKACVAVLVGLVVAVKAPPPRDERGLSQSAETAIMIAGAVTIALFVVAFLTAFVRGKLSNL